MALVNYTNLEGINQLRELIEGLIKIIIEVLLPQTFPSKVAGPCLPDQASFEELSYIPCCGHSK